MVLDKESRELTAAEIDLIGGGKRAQELKKEAEKLQEKAGQTGGKGAGGASLLV